MTNPADLILKELNTFLQDKPESNSPDLLAAYTTSPDYLKWTLGFHKDESVIGFMERVREFFRPEDTIMDVGCCTGFTGLSYAMDGHKVIFHDFEGLGLSFVRYFIDNYHLNASVVSYNTECQSGNGQAILKPANWAVALDVLEHTSNHLSFLRWMSNLGRNIAITYPLATYHPPYITPLDEWVDDEAIRQIVHQRYDVACDYYRNNRRFLIYQVR